MTLIPVWSRGQVVAQAMVDDADAGLSVFRWTLQKNTYAIRCTRIEGRGVTLYMHREILGLTPGCRLEGDHINHNTLDNQRVNLRAATRTENARSRRPFKGGNQYTVRKRQAA